MPTVLDSVLDPDARCGHSIRLHHTPSVSDRDTAGSRHPCELSVTIFIVGE